MKNEKENLDEQQAPEKNSDAAFVQVDKDGKPIVSKTSTSEEKTANEPPKEGTLADR